MKIEVEENIIIEQIERIFAYELYHQWSLLKDKSLILNGEPGKLLNDSYKYPDMVLHGGQGDGEHNKIAVEIKRSLTANNTNITNDFEKLSKFLEKRGYDIDSESDSIKNEKKWKNYENAVFILFGEKVEKISEALKSYNGGDEINDIICITYNYDSDNNKYTLEIARISDLNTGMNI